MLSLVLAILLSVSSHAEECPRYLGEKPTAVVDVKELKFFYFSRGNTSESPSLILVEKDGQVTDVQKAYFWADDVADSADFYGKNVDISCTYGLEFISARYQSPEGQVFDYTLGDCRTEGHPFHPLICN